LRLAKAALDLGLYTNDLDAMLEFWQVQVGAPFTELLPIGSGVRQHRHAIGESVLKINHARDRLPEAQPAGFARLTLARDDVQARSLIDPDGNPVDIVAPGTRGVQQIEVELAANDPAAHHAFYGNALGLPQVEAGVFTVGASRLRIVPGRIAPDPAQRARGYRYITLQVYDVRAAHAAVLAAGGAEGLAPVRLGAVAHISFVRDPDGNWIELSQRKSITGTLD
jgi:lactoylglutathione lyase